MEVYRKSENKIIPFTIDRGDVPIKSVDAFYMLSNDLGYIKINKFSVTTYEEFKEALDSLLNKGMQKLVLDLRHNPGGYLQVATQIIDEFLEEDLKLTIFTQRLKAILRMDMYLFLSMVLLPLPAKLLQEPCKTMTRAQLWVGDPLEKGLYNRKWIWEMGRPLD